MQNFVSLFFFHLEYPSEVDYPIEKTQHDTKRHNTTRHKTTRHNTTQKDTKIEYIFFK